MQMTPCCAYGSDKPDLRFGMEITDITEEMRTLGLEGFPAAIEAGAVARAIVLPAAGGIRQARACARSTKSCG